MKVILCVHVFNVVNKICVCLQHGVFVNDLTERRCHDSKELFDVFNDGEGIIICNYYCVLIKCDST